MVSATVAVPGLSMFIRQLKMRPHWSDVSILNGPIATEILLCILSEYRSRSYDHHTPGNTLGDGRKRHYSQPLHFHTKYMFSSAICISYQYTIAYKIFSMRIILVMLAVDRFVWCWVSHFTLWWESLWLPRWSAGQPCSLPPPLPSSCFNLPSPIQFYSPRLLHDESIFYTHVIEVNLQYPYERLYSLPVFVAPGSEVSELL